MCIIYQNDPENEIYTFVSKYCHSMQLQLTWFVIVCNTPLTCSGVRVSTLSAPDKSLCRYEQWPPLCRYEQNNFAHIYIKVAFFFGQQIL